MFAKADKDGDGKLICLKEKLKSLKYFTKIHGNIQIINTFQLLY